MQSERLSEHRPCLGNNDGILSDSGKTFIKYYLAPDLKEEDDDQAPIRLVRMLNRQRMNIKRFIPNLSDNDLLLMEEILPQELYHMHRPYTVSQNYTELSFNVTFTDCGTVHVIAEEIPFSRWFISTNTTLYYYENQIIQGVYDADNQFYPYGYSNTVIERNEFEEIDHSPYFKLTEDEGRLLSVFQYSDVTLVDRFPSSFQIINRLDYYNQRKEVYKEVDISELGQMTTVTLSELRPNTVYNVYIAFKNNYPIYDSLADDYIAQLNVKTLRKISKFTSQTEHL